MIWFNWSQPEVENTDKGNEDSLSANHLWNVPFLKKTFKIHTENFDPREFVCGYGAAFINITVTYPIYKLIFRQMLYNVEASLAYRELKGEGINHLYRGMLPPLCQKTASMSVMFGVYEEVRRPLFEAKLQPHLAKSIAGVVAGTCEAFLTPFERIQTLLQDRSYNTRFKNTHHAFMVILKTYGVRECYRGLTPILIRNGPSNALYFNLRDEAKGVLPTRSTLLGQLMQEFLTGACIGAFIGTFFYPLNVVKVHVQHRLGGQYENVFKVFMDLCSGSGWKSLYRGVHLNYTRAFISWGVITASYEFFHRLLY